MEPKDFDPAVIERQIRKTNQLVTDLCRDLTGGIEATVSNSVVKAHIYAKIADAMMQSSHYALVDATVCAEEYLHPPIATNERR